MESSHFPVADVYGHTRVFGTSFSFLNARLAVVFVLVAVLSSFVFTTPPDHYVIMFFLTWAC